MILLLFCFGHVSSSKRLASYASAVDTYCSSAQGFKCGVDHDRRGYWIETPWSERRQAWADLRAAIGRGRVKIARPGSTLV